MWTGIGAGDLTGICPDDIVFPQVRHRLPNIQGKVGKFEASKIPGEGSNTTHFVDPQNTRMLYLNSGGYRLPMRHLVAIRWGVAHRGAGSLGGERALHGSGKSREERKEDGR